MMLMFFDQMPELIPADRLLRWMDLRLGPGEYLFGPDAVNRILHELPVLHHPLHIIGYPGLFLGARLHPHIAKQLCRAKARISSWLTSIWLSPTILSTISVHFS